MLTYEQQAAIFRSHAVERRRSAETYRLIAASSPPVRARQLMYRAERELRRAAEADESARIAEWRAGLVAAWRTATQAHGANCALG